MPLYLWRQKKSQNLVHLRGVFFFCVLFDGNDAEFQRPLSEGDLDHVPRLDVVGRLDNLGIDADVTARAGFVGNGTPFYHAGNFQKLIETHRDLF